MIFSKNTKAFTLVEILLGIVIVSMIMVSAFQALSSIGIGKIRLIQKTQTQKQALYFSEKLFEMIKYGGTIDYEEYFNRKVVNTNNPSTIIYGSGHYIRPTGFGNFAPTGIPGTTSYKLPPLPTNSAEYYHCETGVNLNPGDGCYASYISAGQPQAYGQYSFQFIDYNSDGDGDGDENGDGSPLGDDDDEFLGEGPEAFGIGTDVKELYLINGVKRERTYFRYNVKRDPYAGSGATWTCTTSNSGATYEGNACLGTIEYLKLEGRDRGLDHTLTGPADITQNDGVIDTWIISPEFTSGAEIIAGSNATNYWQPLFPENIHVSEFKVFPHPNIDTDRAWRVSDPAQNVAEYVRLQLSMQSGRKERRKLNGNPKEYKLSTTINLTDIFTR